MSRDLNPKACTFFVTVDWNRRLVTGNWRFNGDRFLRLRFGIGCFGFGLVLLDWCFLVWLDFRFISGYFAVMLGSVWSVGGIVDGFRA